MKKIKNFQIVSAIFVMITGTLLHFTYEWFPNCKGIALISAVNESTWEHLKLVFFPMLFSMLVGLFYLGNNRNVLFGKLVGTAVAMSFIVVFFYTYTGIIGENFAALDIGSFFIAVILGEYEAYKIMISDEKNSNFSSIVIWCILIICFIVFTYNPPHIGLFKDPLTGTYGEMNK